MKIKMNKEGKWEWDDLSDKSLPHNPDHPIIHFFYWKEVNDRWEARLEGEFVLAAASPDMKESLTEELIDKGWGVF